MLFANNANATLNGGITAIATSMVVTSATGFPSPTGSQYFYCTLADAATQTTIEIVKVTAVSGTTFTIVRGQDGTTGTIFASGAVVSLRLVAASLNDFPKLDEANTFTGTITFSTPLLATNMVQSTTSTSGYLSATDWNTFNSKGSGSVTSVSATVPSFLSVSGSPITTSGTLALTYSGTALPVANGGTGLSTLTANYIPYGNGTSAFQSSSGFTFDGTNLQLASANTLNWNSDTYLRRDAANTLAQRNSTNAQTFRLYNTYTDASNYERLSIDWSTTANTATISTQNAGTGSARNLAIGQDLFVNSVRVGLGGGSVSTNTVVGNGAIATAATGIQNSAFGNISLNKLTSGANNTAGGFQALFSNTTASGNSAFGTNSQVFTTTGGNNTSNGYLSLYVNTIGANNLASGFGALYQNTTASNLTAVGASALQNNTTNVATLGTITGGTGYTNGTYTGVVMTLSSGSTAITYPTATIVVSGGAVTTVTLTSNGVGFKDTTTVLTAPAASIGGTGSGFSVPVATLASGTGNVAVGYQAGYSNSTGSQNTFTGYQAGYAITTGSANAFYGNQAGLAATTAAACSAFGLAALYNNTSGSYNTAFGFKAGLAITTATNNTAIGQQALLTTTGNNNTALGAAAGYGTGTNANTTGSNNTYIGYQTAGSANNNTNEMVIGYNAVGLGSNTTVIGNSSTTLTKAFGVIVGTNYTVATLPSASTSGVGARAFVTDALAPVFGATVVTGGAVATPVYSDGTNWKVG